MSNKEVIFAKGSEVAAGTVMGLVTSTGKYMPFNPEASDGNEIPAGISYAKLMHLKAINGQRLQCVYARSKHLN